MPQATHPSRKVRNAGTPGYRRKSAPGCILAALFMVVSAVPLQGQSDPSPSPSPAIIQNTAPPAPYWANRGVWNLGVQLGFGLENPIPHDISHIALLIAQPQLGLIAHDYPAPKWHIARLEVVNEGIFGNALHPGGRLAGYALLFRADCKNHGHVVPFFDLGGGVQRTTLATRAPELSGRTQFSPQLGLGIQHFFNPQRALVLEYRFLHMSNAGLVPPNRGFDTNMITIGFRWLRRPRPQAWQASTHRSQGLFHRLFGSD